MLHQQFHQTPEELDAHESAPTSQIFEETINVELDIDLGHLRSFLNAENEDQNIA